MSNQIPLPPEISYGFFKPKGYYTQFKQWPITPMSSNQYWTPDQIVRFLVTIKQGVMDPYRSHIQIAVSVPLETYPVGGLQVDSSAQSFIAQTVISSNNVQIQRIAQYDTLACYLTDVGFSQYVCQSRQVQGLGYSNLPSHSPWSTQNTSKNQVLINNTLQNLNPQIVLENSCGLIMPSRVGSFSGKGSTAITTTTQGYLCSASVMDNTSVSPSLTNILWQGPGGDQSLQTVQQSLGRFNNVRQQYLTSLFQSTYPDTPSSFIQTCPIVANQNYNVSQITSNTATSGYNPKNPYQITISPVCASQQYDWQSQQYSNMNYPNTCNMFGFQKPICSQFARGTCETMLSPTIPQCQMQNGNILPSKIPVSTQIFRLPLISSICGILIPPEQFLLIPIESMYNLLLQITLSRFAMFTSGYCDVHQFDLRGMATMQQRKWIVSNIAWNLHLYTFSDNNVNKQIDTALLKTIPVSSTSYILASQYQLPNGQVVRNSWPIGSQSQSLCEVIALFISNQYQQYSFCRKQFRLSNNITSMQIKYNTQFFPSQPIIGNAGNPQIVDTTGDNWPFYQQILLSTNYMFNTNFPTPKINMKNFAINARCYNTSNVSTFWDPLMLNNTSYNWQTPSVNADTAMGMTSFHQNRYVGKAAFVYSWQPYGHSKNYMTGLNTQGVQNFSLIFNTHNSNPFPRDQTLLIFTRQNILTIYSQNGIKVIGL